MDRNYDVKWFSQELEKTLRIGFSQSPEEATDRVLFQALCRMIGRRMEEIRAEQESRQEEKKRIYYLCMEFLVGKSLENNLFELGLYEVAKQALEQYGVSLEGVLDCEPDPGLGNGGLGRLAACFMESLATGGYAAMGYGICYEYGFFRQKIVDGGQVECPDDWTRDGMLPTLLRRRDDRAVPIQFGGKVEEFWDGEFHYVKRSETKNVTAVPYDFYVPGYGGKSVARIRLYKAEAQGFDMELWDRGEYSQAIGKMGEAEAISKVLYPNDNHPAGKRLRLAQQYFLVAACVADIVRRHLSLHGSLDSLPDCAAIHINDTHPALVIPELMRVFMDDCGFPWDRAWEMTVRTVSYTNHTVMPEALECWGEDLVRDLLPRHYVILKEIDRRAREEFGRLYPGDPVRVERMAVFSGGVIRMANLCVIGSHCVNGVSKLHSKIVRDVLFGDFSGREPQKFTNVTNGIAARRWLCQGAHRLDAVICELIGGEYRRDFSKLTQLEKYLDDPQVPARFLKAKLESKLDFAQWALRKKEKKIDPQSVFDVQVKRLHEYKRQHMGAIEILYLARMLLENPSISFQPRTFLFGAKAAPGYRIAKQIIRLISAVGRLCESEPRLRERISVVFLEEYNVTMAQCLMPACDFSQQISLAGTEASGTGNMKLMLSGAITVGTRDGANIEIAQAVGEENIILFGMDAREVIRRREAGYDPRAILKDNPQLAETVEMLRSGIAGEQFQELYDLLTGSDYYMALADFSSYHEARMRSEALYSDQNAFAKASFLNTARAGIFSSDRAVAEYAERIWHLS